VTYRVRSTIPNIPDAAQINLTNDGIISASVQLFNRCGNARRTNWCNRVQLLCVVWWCI